MEVSMTIITGLPLLSQQNCVIFMPYADIGDSTTLPPKKKKTRAFWVCHMIFTNYSTMHRWLLMSPGHCMRSECSFCNKVVKG